MKKLKYILILSLLMVPVGWVNAAGSGNVVSITEETNITLSSPSMTLVLGVGSTFYSMEVGASTIIFIVSPGGKVVLTSNDRYRLNPDISAGVTNWCATSYSRTEYNKSTTETADTTITFTPTATACDSTTGTGSTSGSQGGSGAGAAPAATPATGTQSAVKTVSGSQGGTLSTIDKKAGVTIPAGLASGNVSMNITPKDSSGYSSPKSGYQALSSQLYDFSLSVGGVGLTQFSSPVTLTFEYLDSDIAGIDENTLQIYYWDGTQWVLIGGTVDQAKNIITADVTHFTLFAVFGQKTSDEQAGDLIKLSCPAGAGVNHICKAVYYLGSNNKRYVFPNETTYKSWYVDFSSVKTVASDVMASYPIGGNVTMRPGTYLVKITTDPKTYAVEPGGKLRWVESEAAAKKLYGTNWVKKIVDVSDAFFINYDASQAVSNPVKDKHPVGTLIKYADSDDKYYVTQGNLKRLFKTDSAFDSNDFRDEFVLETDVVYDAGANIAGYESALKTTAGP